MKHLPPEEWLPPPPATQWPHLQLTPSALPPPVLRVLPLSPAAAVAAGEVIRAARANRAAGRAAAAARSVLKRCAIGEQVCNGYAIAAQPLSNSHAAVMQRDVCWNALCNAMCRVACCVTGLAARAEGRGRLASGLKSEGIEHGGRPPLASAVPPAGVRAAAAAGAVPPAALLRRPRLRRAAVLHAVLLRGRRRRGALVPAVVVAPAAAVRVPAAGGRSVKKTVEHWRHVGNRNRQLLHVGSCPFQNRSEVNDPRQLGPLLRKTHCTTSRRRRGGRRTPARRRLHTEYGCSYRVGFVSAQRRGMRRRPHADYVPPPKGTTSRHSRTSRKGAQPRMARGRVTPAAGSRLRRPQRKPRAGDASLAGAPAPPPSFAQRPRAPPTRPIRCVQRAAVLDGGVAIL
eukprot:gene8752-biopygen4171